MEKAGGRAQNCAVKCVWPTLGGFGHSLILQSAPAPPALPRLFLCYYTGCGLFLSGTPTLLLNEQLEVSVVSHTL